MVDMRPSPQTTLGILLGASKWPHSSLQDSLAFAKSAQKVRDYFLHSGRFGIRQENWLDLFDRNQSSPYEVDRRISTFLQERTSLMKKAGMPAKDLLFYYIGHGIFALGPDQAFHLAIRSTRDESLRASAIAMAALAETLKTNARQLRRFVILDCCFAAEAFKYMQSAPYQAAQKQTISAFEEKSRGHGFPRKGTTLLCSSGHKEASLLLPDESGTMFSEAFIQTLVMGNARQREKTHLSLYDMKMVLEGVLEHSTKGNAPRPFVSSPDQSDGDVASIPFFPNARAQIKRNHKETQVHSSEKMSQKNRQKESMATNQAPLLGPNNLVYLVRGKDSGKAAWHYVLIDQVKLPAFLQVLKTGSFDVSQYGKILYSGWGEDPPSEIVEAIKSQYS
jgi:hypothetical protein